MHIEPPSSENNDLNNNVIAGVESSQHSLVLNDASIDWNLEKGSLHFFGVKTAAIWIDPSIKALSQSIIEELGIDLFRLISANASSRATNQHYKNMTSLFADDFESGFKVWGEAIATAGWGRFKLLEFSPKNKHAIIQIDNPWELSMQKDLPCDQRWGCPFVLGNLIGVFRQAFDANCWGSDVYSFLDNGESQLRVTIYESDTTINQELKKLRSARLTQHEKALSKEIKQKTEALQKSNKLLKNIANLDFLTNLNNRRSLERKLSSIVDNGSWENHTLMFIDLDQFKIVNDTCGHLAGDRLLTIASKQITKIIDREDHFIARYGGDEFTILLRTSDTSFAVSLANNIRKAIYDIRFEWNDRIYQISCSIGLIPLRTLEARTDSAIIAADNACYQAKMNGRNQIYISEELHHQVETRLMEMNWVQKIKEAISNNRFELYFQLIMPLHHSDKISLEALIRMIGDDGSLIMPGEFLPAAEHYNVIFELDCWVIKDIFEKLRDLDHYYDSLESIAINLSGNTLSNPKFENFIDDCFKEYEIDATKICFELTETHMMMNLETAKNLLSKLQKHGCTVSLDDFGAGMSSFGYLRELPVDKIKVDGSFVQKMHESMVDYTFVESITNVAKAMNIKTIAEFVQNDRIVELLADMNVDYVQGYFIGKPHSWQDIFQKSLNRNFQYTQE